MTAPAAPTPRADAVRRVTWLNRATIGWNVVEGVVAVAAGIAAGSVALLGFGLDSGVEVATSLVLAWRLAQERHGGCMAEFDHRATRAIGVCFAALAAYVGVEAVAQLATAAEPEVSVPGMVVAGLSLVLMPAIAWAKLRLAPVIGSQAVAAESRQTLLCAALSGVLLAGLALNAALGWWWADPVAGLAIAGVAGYEAVRTWRAEALEDTCCG